LNERQAISILEDSFGETRLNGATESRVLWTDDLIKLINKASEFRKTAKTEKNDQSSRSHAICRLTITDPQTPAAAPGLLYLIDLAGSEVGTDTANHSAELMKDCKMINKSLSVLKDCILGRALCGQEKTYVPFRQSALTKTLKHVFDPEAGRICKTSVIACINPSYLDAGASKSTLRYAEMLRVPLPKPKELEFDSKNPTTWTNEQARKWISDMVCPSPRLLQHTN
jgi:kinesin family protein 2/24